jgi:hypothetical protein
LLIRAATHFHAMPPLAAAADCCRCCCCRQRADTLMLLRCLLRCRR